VQELLRQLKTSLSASLQDARSEGSSPMKLIFCIPFTLMISTAPAAAVEQCRFIRAKAEREACYERQAAELAAKRKPEPPVDTRTYDSLRDMRREDAEVYRSLRSICRGC